MPATILSLGRYALSQNFQSSSKCLRQVLAHSMDRQVPHVHYSFLACRICLVGPVPASKLVRWLHANWKNYLDSSLLRLTWTCFLRTTSSHQVAPRTGEEPSSVRCFRPPSSDCYRSISQSREGFVESDECLGANFEAATHPAVPT